MKQGIPAAKKHITGYILAFTAAALMLTFGGYTGYTYLSVAAALGLSWLYMAWSGYEISDDRLWAKRLFVFSMFSITVKRGEELCAVWIIRLVLNCVIS